MFKKGGGEKESERLGVPLLGIIPISQEVMEATDAGLPIVFDSPESVVSKIFREIADRIVQVL